MKKLKMSLRDIEGAQVLSREQLKSFIGGNPPVGGSAYSCLCENGDTAGAEGCDLCETYCKDRGGKKCCEPWEPSPCY